MIYEDVDLGYITGDSHSFRIHSRAHINSKPSLKMLRTKQEKPSRARFPKKDKKKKKEKKGKEPEPPKDGSAPNTSTAGDENEMTLRQANLNLGDSQTWPDPKTLMPPQTVAQLEEQVTLPRHVSIEGMDTSFIKYFHEHGMTPILMHTLEMKRGWTGDMIT